MSGIELKLSDVFKNLTEKQRATAELLADGFTSKEIAKRLDISESAAIQRIETLRAKTGGMLRKDVARAYRDYRDRIGSEGVSTCNLLTGTKIHLSEEGSPPDIPPRNHGEHGLEFRDAVSFEISPPWSSRSEPTVVPEVLNGRSAALNRMAVAAVLAVALVVLMLVLLAVATSLEEVL